MASEALKNHWREALVGAATAGALLLTLRQRAQLRRQSALLSRPAQASTGGKRGRVGVMLVNLGTPDSTAVGDVRKYLREFLSDGRVIDIPAALRWALVNLVIAPFRAPSSAALYRKICDPQRGLPLAYHSRDLATKVQESLGDDYCVELAMRYQSPSLASALARLRAQEIRKLVVVPLFPQYASATTGSVIQRVMELVKDWRVIPSVEFVSNFLEDDKFLAAWEANARQHMNQEGFDHVVFSFHGVPESHLRKESDKCKCDDSCCGTYDATNRLCYRAQCFQTSRLLANKLGLAEGAYTVSFQSRLGRAKWVGPYTDHITAELPSKGFKKVLVFSPAFVADCLETTEEVGCQFYEIFKHHGGDRWQLVESLNSSPLFVECVAGLARSRSD
eukprot:TRINITY_DN15592_c0_g1_i1.p1 TRINITY_DN15592_c0_g1~~TRINITY_DN15592_c0_g1_i1.p1  ORF type:complete len:391 (-),score=62.80 TRINITY_DN15592_c0_g1_i1:36-1208(-)